ncbi:hypothetical protein AJ80_06811 [Polytolypa hystricis UAMH7299]|uniref:Lanthionine synthetase C family protein n=1 Tax=Polytolypa hystricis (strain UAMH7299) TaxID=1447883 RepID=A0A2B7XTU6_POLH7|nr:hypothetical protein AJ80_06811 [Polytolypa hystricis UAMH7299]
MTNVPQSYENNLQLVSIDEGTLHDVLQELRRAVRQGVQAIEDNAPLPATQEELGTLYNDDLGIDLMFLRLEHQARYLAKREPVEALTLSNLRINPNISRASNLRPGRLSPLGSASLGAAVVRMVVGAVHRGNTSGNAPSRIHRRDIETVHEAVNIAIEEGQQLGGDEALYGRAGLLWAVLNLRKLRFDAASREALEPVFDAIPKLVGNIIGAGILGAQEYLEMYGESSALPLMWPWHGKYYAGAIHGIAGILADLLICEPNELEVGPSGSHLPIIARTISGLCKLCISSNGHFPSSLPPRPSSRRSPLVQICHGPPGLLLLLSYAKSHKQLAYSYWEPDWDKAIRLASERVWEEGLLSKGGGLCHGIAGNAWPFLSLHDTFEYEKETITQSRQAYQERTGNTPLDEGLSGDYFLSRALTFLLYAQKTRPFQESEDSVAKFRLPDAPYSLFEGLAGTICAWTDACVVIEARLRKMELDEKQGATAFEDDNVFQEHLQHELGIPGFSVHGWL